MSIAFIPAAAMARSATTRLIVCTLLCSIACTVVVGCNLKSALEEWPVCEPFKLPTKSLRQIAFSAMMAGWALTLIFAVSRFAEWVNHEHKIK